MELSGEECRRRSGINPPASPGNLRVSSFLSRHPSTSRVLNLNLGIRPFQFGLLSGGVIGPERHHVSLAAPSTFSHGSLDVLFVHICILHIHVYFENIAAFMRTLHRCGYKRSVLSQNTAILIFR